MPHANSPLRKHSQDGVRTLRLLIVEDNPANAVMLTRELTVAGMNPQGTRVDTEFDFLAALELAPDIILCKYGMPTFSGLRALELLNDNALDIPIILISGAVGEEVAVRPASGAGRDQGSVARAAAMACGDAESRGPRAGSQARGQLAAPGIRQGCPIRQS